jgi:hypothetical protein
VRILTAQLDRRNLCAPSVSEKMFQDLVYKIKLIQVIKVLKDTRILMVKIAKDEIIASVNCRGDINQSFPPDHNEHYLGNFKEVFGAEIVPVKLMNFTRLIKRSISGMRKKLPGSGWMLPRGWKPQNQR